MKRKELPLYKRLYHHQKVLGYLDDDKLSKASLSNTSPTNQNLKILVLSGIVFCLFYLVYVAGYNRGIQNNFQINTVSASTDERLLAIEHMQGFSEAYPKYELNVKKTSQNGLSSKDTSETLKDDIVQEKIEDDEQIFPVTISSDFTDKELFENFEEFASAGYITVPDIKTNYGLSYKLPKKNLWWGVKDYEAQYRTNPVKKVIPRLKKHVQLTVEEFHNRFRKTGQPVVFNFENLRDLGFKTQNYTLQELKLMFPFNENEATSKVQNQFVANGIRREDEELDLGPGLVAIERDEQLAKKGKLRSFPRNLKVKLDAITKLNIEKPPLVKNDNGVKDLWQLPTVWMGTSSSDTRFHHDCCDNFVMMISGTKRFTLAPTSDWRILKPNCVGKLKSLCWANVNDPNNRLEGVNNKKALQALQYINKMIVDVGPGDVLYMPAGWFHHIQNLGPTLMVNWWTKGAETCGLMRARNNPDY